jgi:hypothetical protein
MKHKFNTQLFHKVASRHWGTAFKAAAEPDFVLLILGALLFKLNLEAGGGGPDGQGTS